MVRHSKKTCLMIVFRSNILWQLSWFEIWWSAPWLPGPRLAWALPSDQEKLWKLKGYNLKWLLCNPETRVAIAYLEYTHTFKLVKVNNPSLNHAQYPTFSCEAATLYESTKKKKENMVPYVQEAKKKKKSYIESSH